MNEKQHPVGVNKIPTVVPRHGIEMDGQRQIRLHVAVEVLGAGTNFGAAIEKKLGSFAGRIRDHRLTLKRRKRLPPPETPRPDHGRVKKIQGPLVGDRLEPVTGKRHLDTSHLQPATELTGHKQSENSFHHGTVSASHKVPFFHPRPRAADMSRINGDMNGFKGWRRMGR